MYTNNSLHEFFVLKSEVNMFSKHQRAETNRKAPEDKVQVGNKQNKRTVCSNYPKSWRRTSASQIETQVICFMDGGGASPVMEVGQVGGRAMGAGGEFLEQYAFRFPHNQMFFSLLFPFILWFYSDRGHMDMFLLSVALIWTPNSPFMFVWSQMWLISDGSVLTHSSCPAESSRQFQSIISPGF